MTLTLFVSRALRLLAGKRTWSSGCKPTGVRQQEESGGGKPPMIEAANGSGPATARRIWTPSVYTIWLFWAVGVTLGLLARLGSAPPVCLAQSASANTEVQPGKILKEVWEALYLEGVKSGHLHHVYQEVRIRGRPFVQATSTMELRVRRFGQALTFAVLLADYETPQGQVASLTIQMQIGRDQRIVRRGTVIGQELVMQVQIGQQPPREVRIPWTPEALGLYAEERFFSQQKWQPGDKRSYCKFVPELDRFVRLEAIAEDFETSPQTRGQKWLRLRLRYEKIPGVELADTLLWLDERGEPVRQEMNQAGLGKMLCLRTSKEDALAPGPAEAVDIALTQMIRVSRPIAQPLQARKITYRLTLKSGQFAEGVFPQDDRQRLRQRQPALLELEVSRSGTPSDTDLTEAELPREYLRSNPIVNCEDRLVQQYARQAIANATDAWQKALRIERWVHEHMREKTYAEAFASADEVARTLAGDCTEHAVLAAAMCRAVGVPSRLAMGLFYVPRYQAFVPHMWLEVWIRGRWYGLDPTLGQGHISAVHLKVAHHSWNDVQPTRPLLVFQPLLPHLQIEVLSVE